MAIKNANDHPYKVALATVDDGMYANSHPYQVAIVEGGTGGYTAKKVQELPAEGEVGYIYLVPKTSAKEKDVYDEYIWALQEDDTTYGWEHLGATNEVTITLYDTTGANTDGAMTQKAATGMVFVDGYDPARNRNDNRIAIGAGAKATKADSVAIGRLTEALSPYSTSLGYHALSGANSRSAVAVGHGARVNGPLSIAIGGGADNYHDGEEITAVGAYARAEGRGGIALGAYSKASVVGEMNIGTTQTTCGYNESNYRLLSGLYDPQNDHDAATKGYVDSHSATELTDAEFDAIFGTNIEEES